MLPSNFGTLIFGSRTPLLSVAVEAVNKTPDELEVDVQRTIKQNRFNACLQNKKVHLFLPN